MGSEGVSGRHLHYRSRKPSHTCEHCPWCDRRCLPPRRLVWTTCFSPQVSPWKTRVTTPFTSCITCEMWIPTKNKWVKPSAHPTPPRFGVAGAHIPLSIPICFCSLCHAAVVGGLHNKQLRKVPTVPLRPPQHQHHQSKRARFLPRGGQGPVVRGILWSWLLCQPSLCEHCDSVYLTPCPLDCQVSRPYCWLGYHSSKL
jgi:hypothetical protein